MSITVAEEGNARKGGMSRPEITQCILDINAWFDKHASKASTSEMKYDMSSSSADIERIEKMFEEELPIALELLIKSTGEMWFLEKKLLNPTTIYNTMVKYKLNCVPFCGVPDEGMLVVSASGEVCEWDADDGLGDVTAHSVASYLESYRNFLLENNCEFVSEIGVIESVKKSRK